MKKRSRFVRSSDSINEPLLNPLFDDTARCEELLDKEDTQFARRALVRASFAFIEGILYWFKERTSELVIETFAMDNTVNVTKLELLQDEVPRVGKHGKIEFEPHRAPFKNYCAFILRTAAECAGLDPTPYFADNGWKCMQKSLDVRHRITHPKKAQDLEISDDELYELSESHRWLFNSIANIAGAHLKTPNSPSERSK